MPLHQPTRAFPFFDAPLPLAFAHRGGAEAGAENSLERFGRALEMGYRYLETDLRVTADGVVIAFHDATLDRATDATGRIAALPYAAVRQARIGGREPIPTLEDVLGTFPAARVNVDVKERAVIAPLAEVVRRTAAADRICVAAFSDARLGRARAVLGPRVASSLGPRGIAALRLAAYAGRPAYGLDAVQCAQVPERFGTLRVVDRRFVDTAHSLGMQVHVWTVNDPADMRRLLDLGADGIITDRLAALRELLVERHQWPPER